MAHLASKQFLYFLFVGGSATALQFVILIAFVELFGINKVAASGASYLLSAVYNYCLNYHLTFKSKRDHAQTLPKFMVVVALGVLVNTSIFAACLVIMPYVFAQLCAIVVALVFNFLLHKFWIYRGE